jgi:transcriptional regulator with XRE-family HTH domain
MLKGIIVHTIGTRLKNVRTGLGFNQTDFAERCGITKRSQINYEKDERSPDASYLTKLNQEFGVDITWLLTGTNPTPELKHNLDLMLKATAEMDPDGHTSLTTNMHKAFEGLASPPPEPELKLSRKDRAFWEMYKELDEKDQREIYHDIQEKKRLAELERYYQENERKKNA